MFRMKMMGKRVNYGGRSVISPDPYITTDQIGVPIFMARKLTFPESVSSFNAEMLFCELTACVFHFCCTWTKLSWLSALDLSCSWR